MLLLIISVSQVKQLCKLLQMQLYGRFFSPTNSACKILIIKICEKEKNELGEEREQQVKMEINKSKWFLA